MRGDGTRPTQLTHDAHGNHSFTPAWSPDGTKIVFAHATTGEDHTDLDIMDLATHAISVIHHGTDGTHDQYPDWGARH